MVKKVKQFMSVLLFSLAFAGTKAQNIKEVKFSDLKEPYIAVSFEQNLNNGTYVLYVDWGQNFLTKIQDTTVFNSFVQVANLLDHYGYEYYSLNPIINKRVAMKKGFSIAGNDTEYLFRKKRSS